MNRLGGVPEERVEEKLDYGQIQLQLCFPVLMCSVPSVDRKNLLDLIACIHLQSVYCGRECRAS